MAMANLMARLGLDASEFKSGVDGAEVRVKGFARQMQSVSRLIGTGFGVAGVAMLVDKWRSGLADITQYTGRTGIKLLADGEEQRLQQVSSTLEYTGKVIKARIVGAIGEALAGWHMLGSFIGAKAGGAGTEEAKDIARKAVEAPTLEDQKVEADIKMRLDREQREREYRLEDDMKKRRVELENKLRDEKKKSAKEYLEFLQKGEEEALIREQEIFDERKKLAQEIAEITGKYYEDIAALDKPELKQLSVKKSSASSRGMYMGEVNRYDVGRFSAEAIRENKRDAIYQKMNRELEKINEKLEQLAGG